MKGSAAHRILKAYPPPSRNKFMGRVLRLFFWRALLVLRGLWGEVTPDIVRRSAVGRTEELFGSMIWGTWGDIFQWKDREKKLRWWRMVIACHAALTSRSLVPRKFVVAKNLSNVSQICRICSPGIRSARGQWNVRALPPIPHFETPVPSPALFYPEIETAHLRPLFRLFVYVIEICAAMLWLVIIDYKMGLTLCLFCY